MSTAIPLTNESHRQVRIVSNEDYSRFKTAHIIPVVASEIPVLASEFAIVFVKNSETEKYTPAAMMGLKPGENLYCQSKYWQPAVKPLGFSNAPLSLVKTSENSDEVMVFIDPESDLVSNEDGERLFADSGEQTEYLKKRTDALLDVAALTQQTEVITEYLANLNLLKPQKLSIQLPEQANINIDGIYVIDDNSINSLSDEQFLELRKKGLLALIYAHRASLSQVARLIKHYSKLSYEQ